MGGSVAGLPEAACYAAQMADLMGEFLGLEGFRTLEANFGNEHLLIARGRDGGLAAQRARAGRTTEGGQRMIGMTSLIADQSQALTETLQSMRDVPGLQGSFVVSDLGRLLARDMPALFGDEVLAEVGPRALRLRDTMGDGTDSLAWCVVRYPTNVLCMRPLRDGLLIVLTRTGRQPARPAHGHVPQHSPPERAAGRARRARGRQRQCCRHRRAGSDWAPHRADWRWCPDRWSGRSQVPVASQRRQVSVQAL